MNILIGCLSYKEFTGSEIYFYELSTALRDAGHNVSIFSPFQGSNLVDRTNNVTFLDRNSLKDKTFDLVLFSHGSVIWEYLNSVKANKFINIIHSEVLELEKPVKDSKINAYVGIRPTIVNYIKTIVPEANVELIYNPFDLKRFNPINCKKKKNIKDKIVLFPGSLDYLRYKPLKYLLDLSEKQNFKVMHVGRNDYSTAHPNFASYEPTWRVEKYYKQCDIVSGIFLGRTSIEGLLSGKKVLQFDVDNKGTIQKVYWHTEDNLEKFDKNNTVNKLLHLVTTS